MLKSYSDEKTYNNPRQPAILADTDFNFFRHFIKDNSGICIAENKKTFLQNRLQKRLTDLRLTSYSKYRQLLENENNKKELINFINSISTNKTSFFREMAHFDFLTAHLRDNTKKITRFNVWCTSCSTGEEPYSVNMTVGEVLGNAAVDIKILATDIDTAVLSEAEAGLYQAERLNTIPPLLVSKYFDKKGDNFQVKNKLKNRLYFRYLNLMNNFPFNKKFDFIFCRNVMIYFDRNTQQNLVTKLSNNLKSGGYLFVGHTESLNGLEFDLEFIKPAVYRKP